MHLILKHPAFLAGALGVWLALPLSHSRAEPPSEVAFSGPSNSPISAAVAVPAGRAFYFTSGTPAPVANEQAAEGSPERYGDTNTQATGALRKIEAQLKGAGLSLADVVYLRVYVAPDKTKEGKFDYNGWFDAYAKFFGTKENPVKPARSTVGVASLVKPEWTIEIEAVAVYPVAAATTPAVPSPAP
jgi:enamine deaminase RidA (YjgF/YER057c/UK114 family)